MQITFTIPDPKLPTLKEGLLYLHPVPVDELGQPLYTENAWLKEYIRQFVRDEVARGLQSKQKAEIEFDPDDTIIT